MKRSFTLLIALIMGICCVGCKENPVYETSSTDSVAQTVTESIYEESFVPEVTPKPQNFDITLTFLGDMILAMQKDISPKGRFEEYAAKNPPEYFLSQVKDILSADDFTLANLENVFSDRELTPTTKDYEPAF